MGDVHGGEVTGESVDADEQVSVLVAYRHDVHKALGRSHEHAADWLRYVRVNESVTLDSDRDAAVLSRPRGQPEDTIPAHEPRRRIPLLAGAESMLDDVGDIEAAMYDLVSIENPVALHERWLYVSVPAVFSKSWYYSATSLKYHTLLVAALLEDHRAGFGFEEVLLAVTWHDSGDNPVASGKNGVTRVGTHSRYGFGELRVRPADTNRVPGRGEGRAGGGS